MQFFIFLFNLFKKLFLPKVVMSLPPDEPAPPPVVEALVAPEEDPLPPAPEEPDASGIDWSDPKAKISEHFTVEDALLLRSWGVMHVPSADEKASILEIADKLDIVRDLFKESITVTAWIRPDKANCPGSKWDGKSYNRYIYETQVWKNLSDEEKAKKTVPNSPHIKGKAVDWILTGKGTVEECDRIRKRLLPHLDNLNCRMENTQKKGNWIHLDTISPMGRRFFIP